MTRSASVTSTLKLHGATEKLEQMIDVWFEQDGARVSARVRSFELIVGGDHLEAPATQSRQ